MIKKGGFEFCQPFDYPGIPFRCNQCHVYIHLIHECSLPFSKGGKPNDAPNPKSFWRAKNPTIDKEPVSVPEEVMVGYFSSGDLASDDVQVLDSLKPLYLSSFDNPSLILDNLLTPGQ